MHPPLKLATAATIKFGPLVDPTDGFTLKTALAGTGSGALDNVTTGIMLGKGGSGAMAVRHATVTASVYQAMGFYDVTLDTTDTNTMGALLVAFCPGTNAVAPHWQRYQVIEARVYDALLGTDALFGHTMNVGAIGTVTATGGSATTFQCSDITEATANHYNGKQVWVSTGVQADQPLGVVTAYALTGGQGRFTVSPGSPTGETLSLGDKVLIL